MCIRRGKGVNDRGFTLVETAIVFLIGSFLLYTVASAASVRLESERLKSTYLRLELIMKALEQYAKLYKQLPCPANPTLAVDNVSFGDGVGTGGTASGNTDCTAANLERATTGTYTDVPRGAIPVKQLGLNPLVAVDGWGRKFTYVVTEALTMAGSPAANNGFLDYCTSNALPCVNGTDGAIDIRQTSVAATSITTNAAVLVISHGANGWGGYVRDGNARLDATGGSANEDENVDADSLYVSYTPNATDYDDITEYRMRWQMVEP